jgi:hypothetical protein
MKRAVFYVGLMLITMITWAETSNEEIERLLIRIDKETFYEVWQYNHDEFDFWKMRTWFEHASIADKIIPV